MRIDKNDLVQRFNDQLDNPDSLEFETLVEKLCGNDRFWQAILTEKYSEAECNKQDAIEQIIDQGFYANADSDTDCDDFIIVNPNACTNSNGAWNYFPSYMTE